VPGIKEIGFGLFPTPTAVWRPMEGNVRLLRKKVLNKEITREEASLMIGKDVFEKQGKIKQLYPTPTTKGYGHASEGQTMILRKKVEEGVITEEEAQAMMNGTTLRPPRMKEWNFPTPTKGMYKQDVNDDGRYARWVKEKGYQVMLPAFVKLYPTPTTQDAKNNGGPAQQKRNTKPLNVVAGGRLNPDWVEWLMGYNSGYTDINKPKGDNQTLRVSWIAEPTGVPRITTDNNNRNKRLKCLGNSIVPQCASVIMSKFSFIFNQ